MSRYRAHASARRIAPAHEALTRTLDIKRTRSCGVGLNRIPEYELFTAYDETDSPRTLLSSLLVSYRPLAWLLCRAKVGCTPAVRHAASRHSNESIAAVQRASLSQLRHE